MRGGEERGGGRVCRERWGDERGEGDDREGLKHCYENIQFLCTGKIHNRP